jgi:signal transduction histidine kinase/CheY-like chemotaxis protein
MLVTLLVLLLSTVLAVGLATLRATQVGERARAAAGAANLQQAAGVAAAIDAELARFGRDLQAQARFIEHQGALAHPSVLQSFLSNLHAQPAFAWSGVTAADGRVLAARDGRLVGVNVSQRDWWDAAQHGLYFGDVHEAKLLATLLPALSTGEPWRFVDIATPLHEGQRVSGVLAVHLSWPWLRERIALIARAESAQGAQLFIVGRDGRQRLGPTGQMGDALPLQQLVAKVPQGWRVLTWPDGQRCVTAWAASRGSEPDAGLGWVTLVRTPLQALDASSADSGRWIWGVAALVVVVATALAWALSSVFLVPLGHLVARVRCIADGADMPPPPPQLLPAEFARMHTVVQELVAQLREKKAALRQALEQVRGGFDNVGRAMPGVVFTRVQQGQESRYTFFSESAPHYLGVSRQELMADRSGLRWTRHVDEADARRVTAQLARAVAEGTPLTTPYRVHGGDGCWRTLQLTMVPREGGTDAERTFDGIAIDITDLVEAREQAQRASEAKDRFLASMSHELRTPLNGILGFAQLLQDRLVQDEDRRCAGHIRQAGQNLLCILNDVLDLAQLEAGRLELERLPMRLEDVVQTCRELYAPSAAAKSVGFEVSLPPLDMPALLGDAARLQQVLGNLLSNAVKFTAQGRVALSVTLEEPDVHGWAQAQLEVRDTGIGFLPEQTAQLFEPFRQAEPCTARRFGGSGLGLWISRRLVQAMNGHIEVESSPGVGTVMRLRIPFEVAAAHPQPSPGVRALADIPSLHVLVVDDIMINREVLCALLQRCGHVVQEADNGVAAVELVASRPFDLVLMDIEMPVLDGLQATRHIRELPGTAGCTPIWAVSGQAFDHDKARARAAGMDGHLSKPVNMHLLDEVLLTVAQAKAAHQA